jgi:hypothetical protein
MRTLRGEVLREQGRVLFPGGLLLYFHPLAVPVWVGGLAFAFTPAGHSTRVFAVLFLVMLGFLFVAGGKPYYLASAYPPVLAAGGAALERWFATRVVSWRAFVTLMTSTGLVLGLISLPILPVRTLDSIIETLLGWAVPPIGLTHDLHGMYGWEAHAATVDRVYQSLPASERERASVLVQTYSQASAVNVFRDSRTPRAVSGSMSYYLWGPDGKRGDVLISYGFPVAFLQRHYRSCSESARIDAPLARPWDTDLPVYVCREPLGKMAELWPEIRQFGHAPVVRADSAEP